MKGILAAILLTAVFAVSAFAQDAVTVPPSSKPNYFSQLIGFKGGGQYFISTAAAEWSTGVFFETVLAPFIGLEIEMASAKIPITNYDYTSLGLSFAGKGVKDYVEIGGGVKFYIANFSFALGLAYNDFTSGYIVESATSTYVQLPDSEYNFFSVYTGPEVTAQISTDLFAKVGLRFVYGFTPTAFTGGANETMGVRFNVAFAYGL